MRSQEQQDKDESYEALVDAKLEAMMADQDALSAIADDVIATADVVSSGSTIYADLLAKVVIAQHIAGEGYGFAAYDFFKKFGDACRARMRLDAETEVADECARSFDDKAEFQRQQREDMEH